MDLRLLVHRRVVNHHMAGVIPRKVGGHTLVDPRNRYHRHPLLLLLRLPVLSLRRLG